MRVATACCITLIAANLIPSVADAQLFRGRRLCRPSACANTTTATTPRTVPAQATVPATTRVGYESTAQQPQNGNDTPQVNEAEVLRMGDTVQHIDGLYRDGPNDAFMQAMGPPASDADKWFISVLSMQGCAACQRLKRDWETNPWLLALANPKDQTQSWAHYNVYMREDASQAWRWKNLRVTAYPTVLVQPPRSGKYGKPETVVFQGTYGGNPKTLAANITRAIRLYVSKLPVRPHSAGHRAGEEDEESIGADPPWIPTPLDDGRIRPLSPGPDGRPLIPPILDERKPLISIPWGSIITALATGISLPVIIAVVIWAIYYIRAKRKEAGKPLLLDDESLAKLVELLRNVAEQEQPKARTTRSRRTK